MTYQNRKNLLIGDIHTNILVSDNRIECYLDILYKIGYIFGIDKPTQVAGDSWTVFIIYLSIMNTLNLCN